MMIYLPIPAVRQVLGVEGDVVIVVVSIAVCLTLLGGAVSALAGRARLLSLHILFGGGSLLRH